ncbi:MAG: 1-acyl-sn-glycerol-3-phosphate acyltransferase [Clostridia bacterium]|nr:1-acyl-sn-glycerol-3-phosphate acyltransferase [Clostridia bacterium]
MKRLENFAGKICGLIFRALCVLYVYIGFRPKVMYANPERKKMGFDKPVVFTCNHVSHKDGILIAVLLWKYRIHILSAKDQMEKSWIVGQVLSNNRAIPVNRFGLDTGWIKESIRVMKEGNSMIIFPEGHTSKTGEMDKFRPGFALLATMAGSEVVPIAIDGNYNFLFGKRLRVVVGEPQALLPAENGQRSSEHLQREADRFREITAELLELAK